MNHFLQNFLLLILTVPDTREEISLVLLTARAERPGPAEFGRTAGTTLPLDKEGEAAGQAKERSEEAPTDRTTEAGQHGKHAGTGAAARAQVRNCL